jgi:hypothetical protein
LPAQTVKWFISPTVTAITTAATVSGGATEFSTRQIFLLLSKRVYTQHNTP